jgi:hypothetical protein
VRKGNQADVPDGMHELRILVGAPFRSRSSSRSRETEEQAEREQLERKGEDD